MTESAIAIEYINFLIIVSPALESEIKVQHVIKTRHVEILRIEVIVAALADSVVDHPGLLETAGLDIRLIKDVLCVERESKLVFSLDVLGLTHTEVHKPGRIEFLL